MYRIGNNYQCWQTAEFFKLLVGQPAWDIKTVELVSKEEFLIKLKLNYVFSSCKECIETKTKTLSSQLKKKTSLDVMVLISFIRLVGDY